MGMIKEVDFHKYCPLCAYWECNMNEEPCNDCLTYGVNMYSEKPVRFAQARKEPKEKKKGKKRRK